MGKPMPRTFDHSSIMRSAHAAVRGTLAGLRRATAAGYSEAKANLASFDYAKALSFALRHAWAEAKAARNPRRVDPAEYASSFEAWRAERGRVLVQLSA